MFASISNLYLTNVLLLFSSLSILVLAFQNDASNFTIHELNYFRFYSFSGNGDLEHWLDDFMRLLHKQS